MLYKALSRLAVFLSVLPMFAAGQTTTPIITAAPLDPNWNYTLYNPSVNTNINGLPSSNTNPNGAYFDIFSGTNSTNPCNGSNNPCSSNFPGTTNIDNPYNSQNTADFWTALANNLYQSPTKGSPFCFQPSQVTYTSITSGETQSTNMVGSSAVEFLTQQSNVCTNDALVGGGIISTNTFGPYGFYSATMQLANGQQIDCGLWMQAMGDYNINVDMEVVNTAEWSEGVYNPPLYPVNLILNESSNEPQPYTGPQPMPYLQTQFISNPPSYPNLGNTFNTFAFDWEKNYITYYLNGTPIASVAAYDPRIPIVPMNIYLNNGWNTPDINYSENQVPGAMYVTNFSMYHLKTGSCNNPPKIFSSNGDINTYGNPNIYAVESSITFNGNIDFDYCILPQGAPTPAGFNFVFRAVGGITINKGSSNSFIAGANGSPGSKTPLVLMPTACPQ